jgi:transposase, IS30 family
LLVYQNLQSMLHLTLEQRYIIESYLQDGFSQNKIAQLLGKDRSLISREISRNRDSRNGKYRACLAQRKTAERHKNKPKKIRFTASIKSYIEQQLCLKYSPEQIVGEAKKKCIPCVSTERIYQYIWLDKKQGGKLYKHLRTNGKKYRKRGSKKDNRGQIVGKVPISARPSVVEEKTRIGDLEIDLIIGKDHKGALVTINDRVSGMLKMRKIESKEAALVEAAAKEMLADWKPFLHTITSDNGKEFARHKNIAEALEIDYFFAQPYHSWERGANENLNGLVRQYFPKGTTFEHLTDQQVKDVQDALNNRPRKRFDFKSPQQIFNQFFNNLNGVAFNT